MRHKIVFLDRETIGPSVVLNRPQTEHEWTVYPRTKPDQVLDRAADADIIITNKVPLRSEHLAQLPKLKMIAIAATGYDIVDVATCSERGIVVSNVRGYAVNTVPEHTFALIFALKRNLINYRQDVIDGEWSRSEQFCFFSHNIEDLNGATIGIIGRGVLGQTVAKIARALGMQVCFSGRKGATNMNGEDYTPFEEVLAISHVISLHLPLSESTHHLISYAEFEMMQNKPILINTSRGGLVDEVAAVDALDRGLISGLGFDVLSKEPPPTDNPLLAVSHRKNVIITPHVAWTSEAAMQTLWDQTIGHISYFLAGKPTNVIT